MAEASDTQVLFLAMGYPYVVMATNAAMSVRQTNKDIRIKLITNLPIGRIRYQDREVFDDIAVVDAETEENRWVKTNLLSYADCSRNVLLDCDVEVRAPLAPIMQLLDNFDVAARNLPFETRRKFSLSNGDEIAKFSLSEINTGVIFFNRSEGARELFRMWHENFLQMSESRDQPAFLKALLEARTARFFALPPMWNATPFREVDLAQMRRKPKHIRILHYRDPTFWPSVAKKLADVHRNAAIDLLHPSSDFTAQAAEYSVLADQYSNPLFGTRLGRALLAARLKLTSGDRKRHLRVVGKRKSPLTQP